MAYYKFNGLYMYIIRLALYVFYYLQMASAQLNHSMMADKEQYKKKKVRFAILY